MTSPITQTLLAYSMLRGVGPAKLRQLASTGMLLRLPFGSDEPVGIPAIDKAIADRTAWLVAQDEAMRQVEVAAKNASLIVSALDESYPSLLTQTKDDPFILFVRGNLPPADAHLVAVIGTRQPTRHGEIVTQRITEFLVQEKRWIVSGLALGCDSIAHSACVSAGGKTIAVLAHGLHTVAPVSNRRLADQIVESGGALVTEYGFGIDALPQQFVRRDYTQAGLTRGVVMVQSDQTGGSMHASKAAIKYGRWLAVPAPTDADRKAKALKVEANQLLVDGPDEERAKLLACRVDDLHRVRVLRSRTDYQLKLLE
jgi:DNA processing protein